MLAPRLELHQIDDVLRAGAVTLVLTGGLPGTGKTSLAGALADQLGWTVLSSDRTRKELAGITPEESAAAPYREGIYDSPSTERTYAELLDRAQTLLAEGEPVIIDASWTAREHQDAATALAERAHADLVALHCSAPTETTADRIRDRTSGASVVRADRTRPSLTPPSSGRPRDPPPSPRRGGYPFRQVHRPRHARLPQDTATGAASSG